MSEFVVYDWVMILNTSKEHLGYATNNFGYVPQSGRVKEL